MDNKWLLSDTACRVPTMLLLSLARKFWISLTYSYL